MSGNSPSGSLIFATICLCGIVLVLFPFWPPVLDPLPTWLVYGFGFSIGGSTVSVLKAWWPE